MSRYCCLRATPAHKTCRSACSRPTRRKPSRHWARRSQLVPAKRAVAPASAARRPLRSRRRRANRSREAPPHCAGKPRSWGGYRAGGGWSWLQVRCSRTGALLHDQSERRRRWRRPWRAESLAVNDERRPADTRSAGDLCRQLLPGMVRMMAENPGVALRTDAQPGERRTVCWRERDSNFPFHAEIGLGFRLPDGRRCGTACRLGGHAWPP